MKSENAIEVSAVTKKFKVYLDRGRTLKEVVLFSKRRKYEERVVLRGISFEVKKGEAVGLIGHNGCGKSTTLKLLTKIMYPDSGTIEMKGRVSSLIELGAGFHPDMSGRQNIYTNASIFGLTRKEIDTRLENIIAFSELEEYIDNPVRTYSSGMYMRLAFSVAINVDADILLIDEILAVGDANFQAKCFNKLREIKAKGTTIVIVSHSLGQIEQICEKTIWIQDGMVQNQGNPREIHPEYMDYMGKKRQLIMQKEETISHEPLLIIKENQAEKVTNNKRWGNGKASIKDVILLDSYGVEKNVFCTGDSIIIQIHYEVKEIVKNAVIGMGIFRIDGLSCYGSNTRLDQLHTFDLKKDNMAEVILTQVNLLPGEYLLDVAIESDLVEAVDYYREACRFEMYSSIHDIGVARLDHKWKI